MSSSEGGQVTGTQDKDYNLIWFTEQCLSNALRLETDVQDADRDGDSELAGFFRRAQAESKKGADQAKSMLAKRLSTLKRENPARTATQVRRILRAQMGWSPGERTLQRRFAADPQIAALLGLWSTIMLKGESSPSGIPLFRDSLCARRPRGAGRAALCLWTRLRGRAAPGS